MDRAEVAAVSLLVLACNVWLVMRNRSLQEQIGARQRFVQQPAQLEGLYRDIVRSLAELAARNNDADARAMLGLHGITYAVNAPAAEAPQSRAQGAARK